MAEGFNWFLLIIVAVVTALVFFGNAYIIIYLQHPEDKNQAWLPKVVVWMGLSLATLSVLMFPLDVANRGACDEELPLSSCDLTLPMRELWFSVYIVNAILVFFMTPFAIFYYEAGSDRTPGQKLSVAVTWVLATSVVIGLILGIAYALVGYVEFPTAKLTSGSMSFEDFWNQERIDACLSPLSNTSSLSFSGHQVRATSDAVGLHLCMWSPV